MIIIILFIIISESQVCQSKIFEIKEKNGRLKMETMNGFEVELSLDLEVQISQLNQIQTSKCTQNCKDCSRRQCYLGNTELDHSEIKLYDLDTQQMVLQPLTYFNDQNQSHSISFLSLTNPGYYINSFVSDGFQLCLSKTDKTFETSFQMDLQDIPKQQVLLSPILSKGYSTQISINYLKLGDTQIDISSCLIFFKLGEEELFKDDISNPTIDQTQQQQYEQKWARIMENSDLNYLPDWLFRILYLEFEKAGFIFYNSSIQDDFKLVYRNQNDSTNIKLDSKYDLKFFNKENEEYPIIFSSNQYLDEFGTERQLLKFVISKKFQSIVLGTSFFVNKKVQFNFKEKFVTIQNQFDDRCFQYEKSTLYQQEILALQVSIPLIILLALFLIRYQNNEGSSEFQGEDPIKS